MSDLTNTQVMTAYGWRKVKKGPTHGQHIWRKKGRGDKTGANANKSCTFSPTTSIDDALALVPDGYSYQIGLMKDITFFPDGFYARLLPSTHPQEGMVTSYRASNLPLAICKALMEIANA